MRERSRAIFSHPFQKQYWKAAASELTFPKMIAVASILLALRIAVKYLNIPLRFDLHISFDFIVNAVGTMILGPVVTMLTAALSDTIGAFLAPSGPYFFPFIFEEMASSLIFSLFLYRAKLNSLRVILSRFAVIALVNLGLGRIIMYYYLQTFYSANAFVFLDTARIVKNLVLFPFECVILILLLRTLVPLTNRLSLTFSGTTKPEFRKKDVILLVVLTAVGAAALAGYFIYYYFNQGK